jgi:DNA polymerase III subunit alpha
VDLKRVGKRPLEMLARAGAFDALDAQPRAGVRGLDALVAWSAAVHEAAGNQVSLFGEAGDDLPPPRLPAGATGCRWSGWRRNIKAVGFYLSGHPLDDYMPALRRKDVMTLAEVVARRRRGPLVAEMAGAVAPAGAQVGARQPLCLCQLSDPTGLYEVTVFSDVLEIARAHLEPGPTWC